MKDKIEALKKSMAALDEQMKQVKADLPVEDDKMNKMMDMMYSMQSNMYNYIGYVEGALYQHLDGHTPKPKTATQMEAYLKACKMDEDINVSRPTIYVRASANTRQPVFQASLNLKK